MGRRLDSRNPPGPETLQSFVFEQVPLAAAEVVNGRQEVIYEFPGAGGGHVGLPERFVAELSQAWSMVP